VTVVEIGCLDLEEVRWVRQEQLASVELGLNAGGWEEVLNAGAFQEVNG